MLVWLLLICAAPLPLGCDGYPKSPIVIALGDNIRTIDSLGPPSVDAASERVRVLMFNSLVRKDKEFNYEGELASDIKRSDDNLVFTFPLRDGIKFHDGRSFSSADAKYTLDLVLSSPHFAKSTGFFDSEKKSYIKSIEAPDPRTLVVTTIRPWTGLLSNLVAIPIIPKDGYPQKDPVGTGPFKFKSYDSSKQELDVEANPDYWDGPPTIQTLRVRVITDMNVLQADLLAGRVDIAALPTSLSPTAIELLEKDPNLQVNRYFGSNINLLTFNTTQAPLNDVRVRQAIAYAIDRESIIRDLILKQAMIAHSILPRESWAYSPGQIYSFDPSKAKQLLDEARLKDPDGDGPQMRLAEPIGLKVSGSSPASKNCAGQIQSYLRNVGIPVKIQIAELNTLLDEELPHGKFDIFLGQWVGGNQDPVFYKDLTATSEIPTPTRPGRNRSRYTNEKLDDLIDQAMNTFDEEKAKGLYAQIQDIVSRELPIFPLYYQANIAIAKKNIGNIKVDASGNWSFVKNLKVQKEDR